MERLIADKKHVLASVTFVLIGIASYFPVFRHQFQTFWDDRWVVINRYTDTGLTTANLIRILTEYYHGQFAPLNQLYYSILYTLFGYDAFAFHIGSLLIHLVNSCLVYFLVWRLLGTGWSVMNTGKKYWISFLAALFFTLHPVSVEAVAWIAASKILIYALCYFLALHCYLTYLEKGNPTNYILTLLLFVLSFGGKEQAVMLPVCLLLLDFLAQRNIKQWQYWLEKLPFLMLAVYFGLVTMESQAAVGQGVLSNSGQYPFYQRIVFACYSLIEYLTKAFVPVKLSYIYPFPNQIGELLPIRFWLYPLAVVAMVFVGWRYLKQRWILFWAVFFVLHLAVVLHIIPIGRFAITADRYMYVALVAPCFAVAYTMLYLAEHKAKRKYVLIVCLCYSLAFGLYTYSRSMVWRDSDTLKAELKEIIKNRADYEQLQERLDLSGENY